MSNTIPRPIGRTANALAKAIAPLIESYLRAGDELILIGLDGSPSTGVRFTSSQPEWGGRLISLALTFFYVRLLPKET